jgi:hypothetical protein
MSIAAVIALIIAAASALLGALVGHSSGKSAGRKEGEIAAAQKQQVEQAKVIVEAVQERNHVEANVAATPRADLDRELSEFSRPD